MRNIHRLICLLVLFLFAGCATSTSFRIPTTEEYYPPKFSPDQVKIYTLTTPEKDSYKIIGTVIAQTPIIKYGESYREMLKLLKKEAQQLGADGIIDIKTEKIEDQFNEMIKGQGQAIVLLGTEKKEKVERERALMPIQRSMPVDQKKNPFEKGTWELALLTNIEGSFSPFLLYYFEDYFSIFAGFEKGSFKFKDEGSLTLDTLNIMAGSQFIIPTSSHIFPFLLSSINYNRAEAKIKGKDFDPFTFEEITIEGEGEADILEFNIGGGIKIFPTEKSSVNFLFLYTTGDFEIDSEDSNLVNANATGWDFSLGYSLYF